MRDGSGMISCRRGSGSQAIMTRTNSGTWSPSRSTLIMCLFGASLLLLATLTSPAVQSAGSLSRLPAGTRRLGEEVQVQRQRYERRSLEVDPTAGASQAVLRQSGLGGIASGVLGVGRDEEEDLTEQWLTQGARVHMQPEGQQQQQQRAAPPAQQQLQQAEGRQRDREQQQQQHLGGQGDEELREMALEVALAVVGEDDEEGPPLQGQAGSQEEPGQQQPAGAQPAHGPLAGPGRPEHGVADPGTQQTQTQTQPAAGQPQQQAGAAAEQQQQQQQQAASSPYERAVSRCHDFVCLTQAAKKKRAPGQFLFPHFFLIGWQKCATTSLFFHLRNHPQMMSTLSKEPEFFSDECGYQPHGCPLPAQDFYLHHTLRLGEVQASGMRTAGAEASTHYGRNGQLLARGVYEIFPWLKIIASMREPISRAISMLAHNLDKHSKGCLAKRHIYPCLVKELTRHNYSEPFQAWLDVFPRPQVMLVQYENLTSQEHGRDVLRRVKTFLEVDPALPVGQDFIGHNNSRVQRMQRMGELGEEEEQAPAHTLQGWPIKRWQYQELVDMVRPDAERISGIVGKYGFADGEQWLGNWEAEWRANLDSCSPKGDCSLLPN